MKKALGMLLFAAGLATSTANAAVTSYTSAAAWSSALGTAYSTENFNDTVLNAGLTIDSDAGSIYNGVFNDRVVNGGDKTTFSFASVVTGFGATWDMSPGGFGQGLDFYIDNVLVGSINTELTGSFYGFISTTGFNSVVINGGTVAGGTAETYNLDNLVYNSAVPEPTTVALIGLGMLGFAASRRKSFSK